MSPNIRIVLVGTSHPGNIGAAARAIKTMGLEQLYLVAPELFPHAEASAMASGADDLLARAKVHNSLDSALAGCRLVIGASARRRSLPWPEVDPPQCARRAVAEAGAGPVAVIFGRERTGLTNEELERCHLLVHIPANPDYCSLNLAAAVQIIAYEIHRAVRQAAHEPQPLRNEEPEPADAADMAGFYQHLEKVLVDLEFLDPEHPKHLMRRLKRLFNRARPDQRELNILRGILTAVQSNRRRG